jgi:UDP-N-acetyl-D-glucosamine dehydrogenase
MESVLLNPQSVKSYDAILLSTDHDNFDYEMIANNAQLIIDTRNAFGKRGFTKNVVKA